MVEEHNAISSFHTPPFHSVHTVRENYARSHNHVPRKKRILFGQWCNQTCAGKMPQNFRNTLCKAINQPNTFIPTSQNQFHELNVLRFVSMFGVSLQIDPKCTKNHAFRFNSPFLCSHFHACCFVVYSFAMHGELTILLLRRAFGAQQTQPHTARAFGARAARLRRAKVDGKVPHSSTRPKCFPGPSWSQDRGPSKPPAHNADSKSVS